MAFMKDKKPEQFAGEQRVWENLKCNLPDSVICYNHREIYGREFDFCLLIPDIGFLILEVKGWQVSDVLKVLSPDEIYLRNNKDSAVSSPKKQARSYRFNLINHMQEKYHISPLVMDMVCYPFLSEHDYRKIGLSVVSEPEFTIFSEDLDTKGALSRKIIKAYNSLNRTAEDKCSGKIYDICRQCFEPDYLVKVQMPNTVPYSKLSVYTKALTMADITYILKSYSSGTKQIIFVHKVEDLFVLADNLTEMFRERNLCFMNGNLQFGRQETSLQVRGYKLSVFQFEAIYVGEDFFSESFTVYNGAFTEEQRIILSNIPEKKLFNWEQYQIEHAPIGKNIQVRAGAGTGKTYSMISRVMFLCHPSSNSGICAPADEIAMLTFTSDAAVNMKTRLKRMFMNYFLLAKDTRYLELVSDVEKMRISTIHSFAGEVFKNTSLALGIGTNFTTIVGDYERRILFERIFDAYLTERNQESPLFFRDLPMDMTIYDLQKYLRLLSQKIYNKGYDTKELPPEAFGDPPPELPFLQDIIEHVLIPAENEYENLLSEDNALHLLEYMIYLRKSIASPEFNQNLFHFKYIFIDEFQDTDDAQIDAFLKMQQKLLFHFFIVGDLKQSIYRFRGATMDAFQRMGAKGAQWIQYHLTLNYRTDASLLNEFHKVFSDLGRQKLLPYISGVDELIGVSYSDTVHEDDLVRCCQMTELKGERFYNQLFEEIALQKSLIERKLQTQDLSLPERTVAILTRTNFQIDSILKEARKRNVQIESSSGGALYKLQSTLDLCKLTAALCNPYHATYLYDLVASNNVGVSFDPRMLVGLSEKDKTTLLIQCLDEYYTSVINKTWKELLYDAQHKPILMVLRMLYEGTEPWKHAVKSVSSRAFYRANYDLLFEELSRMNKKNYLTLDSVNETLHIAVTTGIEREPRTPEFEQSGVRVLCTTVHKSKGLEYETVILPFTDKDSSSSPQNGIEVTCVDGKVGYCISLNGEHCCNSYFDDRMESTERMMEEARILYVAMTRSIQRFVWFRKDGTAGRSWGGFLEELCYGD